VTFLIVIAILGMVAGGFINSLMEGRGALGLVLSAGIGAVGGFVTGFLCLMYGRFLVGEGPDTLLSLFGAVAGAIVLVLIVALVKKRF
jgi:uncharacterized membrane protein YeaQ/YmgE (transglycosylase-associated protein family)